MQEEPNNSNFDTGQTDALAAVETEELPTIKGDAEQYNVSSESPKRYALDHDIIAFFEKRIMGFEDNIEELDFKRMTIDNAIRWEVEVLAEDKENKLTNETKRQMKYSQLAGENKELQALIAEIKGFRREVKKLGIELRNEQRAYALIVAGGKA